MKTRTINGMLAFFATAILVSCKSDDKKPVTETNSTTTTTTITETTTIDSSDRADVSGTDVSSGTKVSNAKATVKSTNTVKSVKNKSKEDPDILVTRTKDGTDAENHDGNPYTKNDQTPQPTGPPIK